ncbi:MAG: nicotinate (nicotinamide) nucleotide adenylyltransferase [Armatimonadetes bacterium]|nr:nicotinate (nicotinamide) nucleotide adenylyltransferase [Akkermansiaceae bacterium]
MGKTAEHLSRQSQRRRIGIFGGSFDPVHEGHLYLAGVAKEAVGLDEVWFIPCWISPHKTDRAPARGELRVKWLRLALQGIEWAKVNELELKKGGVSYSYETAESLVALHPNTEWYWIMGGDQWLDLPTWKFPHRLAAQVEFIVLARNGIEIKPRDGYRLHVVHGQHPASATEIRLALAAGDPEIPFLHEGILSMVAEGKIQ